MKTEKQLETKTLKKLQYLLWFVYQEDLLNFDWKIIKTVGQGISMNTLSKSGFLRGSTPMVEIWK